MMRSKNKKVNKSISTWRYVANKRTFLNRQKAMKNKSTSGHSKHSKKKHHKKRSSKYNNEDKYAKLLRKEKKE